MRRVLWGREKKEMKPYVEDARASTNKKCADCGVKLGKLHWKGCDVEECPICGRQLISCGHASKVLGSKFKVDDKKLKLGMHKHHLTPPYLQQLRKKVLR